VEYEAAENGDGDVDEDVISLSHFLSRRLATESSTLLLKQQNNNPNDSSAADPCKKEYSSVKTLKQLFIPNPSKSHNNKHEKTRRRKRKSTSSSTSSIDQICNSDKDSDSSSSHIHSSSRNRTLSSDSVKIAHLSKSLNEISNRLPSPPPPSPELKPTADSPMISNPKSVSLSTLSKLKYNYEPVSHFASCSDIAHCGKLTGTADDFTTSIQDSILNRCDCIISSYPEPEPNTSISASAEAESLEELQVSESLNLVSKNIHDSLKSESFVNNNISIYEPVYPDLKSVDEDESLEDESVNSSFKLRPILKSPPSPPTPKSESLIDADETLVYPSDYSLTATAENSSNETAADVPSDTDLLRRDSAKSLSFNNLIEKVVLFSVDDSPDEILSCPVFVVETGGEERKVRRVCSKPHGHHLRNKSGVSIYSTNSGCEESGCSCSSSGSGGSEDEHGGVHVSADEEDEVLMMIVKGRSSVSSKLFSGHQRLWISPKANVRLNSYYIFLMLCN
jgi:hypothetical protein